MPGLLEESFQAKNHIFGQQRSCESPGKSVTCTNYEKSTYLDFGMLEFMNNNLILKNTNDVC